MRAALGLLLFAAGLTTASHSVLGQIGVGTADNFLAPIKVFDNSWYQVRVEQRVIIRVPRHTVTSVGLSGRNSAKLSAVRYKEKKAGKCVTMNRLIGSRPGTKNSLDLVTRDGLTIRAYLGDGCLAREFYAGAYMEQPVDGRLCVDRDLLHARTGAKCEVDKFRLLVAQ